MWEFSMGKSDNSQAYYACFHLSDSYYTLGNDRSDWIVHYHFLLWSIVACKNYEIFISTHRLILAFPSLSSYNIKVPSITNVSALRLRLKSLFNALDLLLTEENSLDKLLFCLGKLSHLPFHLEYLLLLVTGLLLHWFIKSTQERSILL